jgi:CTP:molybdopterin cytidylyltransferase MocA
VEVDDPGVLVDVDTLEDLSAVRAHRAQQQQPAPPPLQ